MKTETAIGARVFVDIRAGIPAKIVFVIWL
jgi:hypothetical protein